MRIALLASLALPLAGCTTHDSDSILTSGIYASLGATATGDGTTTTHAVLHVGNPGTLDFVELVGNDQLVATLFDESKVMSETVLFGTASYSATFDGDEEGLEFNIAFLRTVDAGAPNSYCTLPEPFDVLTEPGIEWSRGASFVIDWTPSAAGDPMSWRAEGECIEPASGTIGEDLGTLEIPAGTLLPAQAASAPTECDITFELRRSRDGELDPGYGEGGSIRGNQVRTVTFASVP